MTSFRLQAGWHLWGLALGLLLFMLLGAASATPAVLKAQASPLAPPAKAVQTSPLPTVDANAGPVSPLATPAAAPLAGTALGRPGMMAALAVLGLVVVGALVWQRRAHKR